MGNVRASVDPVTRKVLFGAQKQGDRALDAICVFVDEYLLEHAHNTLPLTLEPAEDDFMDVKILDIEGALRDIIEKATGEQKLTVAEITFAQLLLGLQEFQKMSHGGSVSHECISETGKCVFYVVPGDVKMEYVKPEGNVADVIAHARKTASKEEEAVALIEKILKDCPNRGDYPEDDALAAIMYGEVYWKKEVQ